CLGILNHNNATKEQDQVLFFSFVCLITITCEKEMVRREMDMLGGAWHLQYQFMAIFFMFSW
ncbi:hypothetical protein ACJX0J_005357, partial [Zea mays]